MRNSDTLLDIQSKNEILCGKAPDRLKVVFVNNENLGQRIYIEGINERTQFSYVAQKVMEYLKVSGLDLSIVPEYSKAIKLFTNQRLVKGEGRQISIEAATGFLTSGITCCVESRIEMGNIRVHFEKQGKFFNIPYHPEDTVLVLKRKISERTKIPFEKQLMKFKQRILTNSQKMRQIGIQEADEVYIETDTRQLSVMLQNGEKIQIQAENDQTIGQIFSIACSLAELSLDGLNIYYNSNPIIMSMLIGELDINQEKHDQFAIMNRKQTDYIHIYVRIRAKSVDFIVNRIDTIRDVKNLIQIKEGISYENQKLFFKELLLDDNQTLQDQNIRNWNVLDLELPRSSNNQQIQQTPSTESISIVQKPSQTPVSKSNDEIQIFVKAISGETITVNLRLSDSIDILKQKINEKQHISIQKQLLFFAGKKLENGKQLKDYKIQNYATLNLELRLLGGLPPKVFTNIENANFHQSMISYSAPAWRCTASGLTLEGLCKNPSCQANDQRVICNYGYTDFDLFLNEPKCPMCNQAIYALSPGFSKCLWRIHYKKANKSVSSFPWKKNEEHQAICSQEAGFSEYDRLVIHAVQSTSTWKMPVKEGKAEEIFPIGESCGLCHKKQDIQANVMALRCGHSYHRNCTMNWIARKLQCPHCDLPFEQVL